MTDDASAAATRSVTTTTGPTEERVPLGRVLVYASPLVGVFLANSLVEISLTGTMLSLTGFQPNIEQTEGIILGLRILAGGFPLIFFSISLILVARFGLDEATHRALRLRLR